MYMYRVHYVLACILVTSRIFQCCFSVATDTAFHVRLAYQLSSAPAVGATDVSQGNSCYQLMCRPMTSAGLCCRQLLCQRMATSASVIIDVRTVSVCLPVEDTGEEYDPADPTDDEVGTTSSFQ